MTREEMVRQFHKKYDIDIDVRIERNDQTPNEKINTELLYQFSNIIESIQENWKELKGRDERITRAQLILSEVSELLFSLAQRDENAVLDALADIAYLVEGTAITFNLPLSEAFDEVHKSNMTKILYKNYEIIKTEDYKPPQLDEIIKEKRINQ